VGELIDDLQRRGVLDRTLVIVTADHGEGLGEHGLSDHGESLYRTEIRVPLVIVLPADRGRSPVAVEQFVSLRDLPATIVDLIGLGEGSPFPGRSLARFWADPPAAAPPAEAELVLSELASPNPADPNRGRSPAYRGPLVALAEGDFVYIRNEGDGGEELFNQRTDPHEFVNLAGAEAMHPVLRRFRDHLQRVKPWAPAVRDAGAAPRLAATPNSPDSCGAKGPGGRVGAGVAGRTRPAGVRERRTRGAYPGSRRTRRTASGRGHRRIGAGGAARPTAGRIPAIGASWAADGNSASPPPASRSSLSRTAAFVIR
jgi:hypothetical protein